ncbi:MAG: S-layer homology domain-containing protein [Patescibacteria group bacterium]
MLRKTRLALPLGFSALLAVLLFHAASFASSFYDVPPDDLLFSPYIQKLYDSHLITGDTQNGKETYSFRPKDPLSRAEFTKVAVGVKLAEKFGQTENWQAKSAYEMTETVLKDKLLYFHQCDNSDIPQCENQWGADIKGVCNVCLLTNQKPFTDVKEKDRNCEEQGICSPWYSEYIYYALRKGMLQGYKDISSSPSSISYSFHPDQSILRIHALKLIMADDGAVAPEADERYRRLSQTAKARGSYFPECLSGAENFILNNNGGSGHPEGEKLLQYALLADKLDFFGNRCQVFSTYGANTPQAKADFLQSYMSRREAARYFVLSTSYSPLIISPFDDETVDGIVSNTEDPESVVKETVNEDGEIVRDFSDVTIKTYAQNAPIPIKDIASPDSPFDSTFNRAACILSSFTPKICKDPSMANCSDVPNGSRIHTTDEEYYGRTPPGYYTWLWHGVIYKSIGYYVPLDDIDFDCERTLQWEEAKRQAEAEAARIRAYNAKIAAQNAANAAAYKQQQPAAAAQNSQLPWYLEGLNPFVPFVKPFIQPYIDIGKNIITYNIQQTNLRQDMPWIYTADYYGNNKDKRVSNPFEDIINGGIGSGKSIEQFLTPVSGNSVLHGFGTEVMDGLLGVGKSLADNIGKAAKDLHMLTVDGVEMVGNGIKYVTTEADKLITNQLDSVPDWLKPTIQPIRNSYNLGKGFVEGGAAMTEGVFQIYKDPIGVVSGIGTAIAHPRQTWSAISKGLNDFANESLSSTDKLYENSGRIIFEIGSWIVGAGEVKSVIKAAEIAKVGNTAAKTADLLKIVDAVQDVGTIAKGLEKIEDVSRVQKVLAGITDMEKTAGIISKMQPAKAAEVVSGLSKSTIGNILTKMDDIAAAKLITTAKDAEKMTQAVDTLGLTKIRNIVSKLNPDEAANVISKMDAGKAGKIITGVDPVKVASILEKIDVGTAAKVVKEMSEAEAGSALLKIGDANKVAKVLQTLSFDKADAILTKMAEQLRKDYSSLVPGFKKQLQAVADKFDVTLDVENVLKETKEIVLKAQLSKRDISQVNDLMRGRWVINTEEEGYKIADYVESNFKIIEFKDNFVIPKNSGYRSLHYYIEFDGRIAEVQIVPRTMFEANEKTHIILDRLDILKLDPLKNADEITKLNYEILKMNDEAWELFVNK